jgi:hypothetical protein
VGRAPVFVRVEIDGREQRRQAAPHHLYNGRGQLVATGLRPTVLPGEVLVDRIGTYPKIIREAA